jgi:co-chaperonin GroES (HSP10)
MTMVTNDWKEKIKKLPLRPLKDQIVISVDEQEQVKSGIIIPDTSQEHPRTGIVMFTGPDVTTVKAGDRVLFRYWDHMTTKLTYDGPPFVIMSVVGAVAVVKG